MGTNNINSNNGVFDKAVALVESTPRQSKVLPSGEKMAYREYNKGQPHVIVLLPGYIGDDSIFSIMAVFPEFKDHHIIAVNPRGWNGSSMKTPICSHEENADEVIELLKLMGVDRAMVGGYSTGGGIAFYMAQKYPTIICAAFLFHSIPINGLRIFDETGNSVDARAAAENIASSWPDDIDKATYMDQIISCSSNPSGFPPMTHGILSCMLEAVKMPGKIEAMIANMSFNVSPIKTPYAEPSIALSDLKSKIIVIHSKHDVLVEGEQVELVTKLAIAENWAPKGMLSFYDSGEGHMVFFDNPAAIASIYRKAFEEQLLSPTVKAAANEEVNSNAEKEIITTSH